MSSHDGPDPRRSLRSRRRSRGDAHERLNVVVQSAEMLQLLLNQKKFELDLDARHFVDGSTLLHQLVSGYSSGCVKYRRGGYPLKCRGGYAEYKNMSTTLLGDDRVQLADDLNEGRTDLQAALLYKPRVEPGPEPGSTSRAPSRGLDVPACSWR